MSATKQDYILAIDNGTQSVRVIVFDLQGQVIAKSQIEIEPYFSKEPGWAEQDPDYYWKNLCKACQDLWPQLAFPKSSIKAVALTTQRATMVNLDKEGRALRPAIVWLDQRQENDLPSMGILGWLFTVLGVGKTVRYFRSQAEAHWIKKQQPEIWRNTHKYLLLSGYHTYKLTGQYVDSVASQVGYLPFDFKKQQWSSRWDWKWRALPIRRSQLPDLVPPGKPLGTITEKASSETGIPAGLPLISSGADKACEVLGSGCIEPQCGSLSYGTTATFNIPNTAYVEESPRIPPYPAAIPDRYNTEVIVQRGFWMVNWFKQEFAHREQIIAAERGIAAEVLFDDLLKQVPPGSMGLTLQPYWNPGIRTPGPEAKGAIIGFGDVHTRAHIYRAIIEGIAYSLREGKERVERRAKCKINRLLVSGGGSKSDEVMQITADVFGMTAERPHTSETSALGAAINAAVGIGLYASYEEAIDNMTRCGKRFVPNAANSQVYDKLYSQVYRKMYARLGPLYRTIQEITGYPK